MDSIPEAHHAFSKDTEVILAARKQLLHGYERDNSLLTPEELEFIKKRANVEIRRNLVYPLTGLVLTSFSIHTLLRRFTGFGPARIGMISFVSATTVFAVSSSYGAIANYREMASGLVKLQNSPIADRTIYALKTQFPHSPILAEVPGSKKQVVEQKLHQSSHVNRPTATSLPPAPPKSIQQQTADLQKTQLIIYQALKEMYHDPSALTREEKDFFSSISTTILWRGVAMPLGLGLLSFFAMRGILRWVTSWKPRTIEMVAFGWSAFSVTTETFGATQAITNQAAEDLLKLDNSSKADQVYLRLMKECPDVPLLRKYPRNPQANAARRDPGAQSDPFQTDLSKYSTPDFSFKPALVHYDTSKETPGLTFSKEDINIIEEQNEEEQPVDYDNEYYQEEDTYEEDYEQPRQTKQRPKDEKSKSFEARQRAIRNYQRKQKQEDEEE